MLLFEADKHKVLEFNPIEVKNINLETLQYFIRVNLGEGIEFGFPGTMNMETQKIVFTLPPLSELVNFELSEDGYDIRLEVIDENKKFFDKPWEERVRFKTVPKVRMENVEDTKSSLQVFLDEGSSCEDNEEDEPEEVVEKPVKKSRKVQESHYLDDTGIKFPHWFQKNKE